MTTALFTGDDCLPRCHWCAATPSYVAYHYHDWGRPKRSERELFETLSLEAFQSGLSWLTILNKREGFRRAFAQFDADAVARFGPRDVERLLQDAGIVRHRGKIEATINNAQRLVELRAEAGSFAAFVEGYRPPAEALSGRSECTEAKQLLKALKARSWRIVGPTTGYAFMQASGLGDDHAVGCRWRGRYTSRQRIKTGGAAQPDGVRTGRRASAPRSAARECWPPTR